MQHFPLNYISFSRSQFEENSRIFFDCPDTTSLNDEGSQSLFEVPQTDSSSSEIDDDYVFMDTTPIVDNSSGYKSVNNFTLIILASLSLLKL